MGFDDSKLRQLYDWGGGLTRRKLCRDSRFLTIADASGPAGAVCNKPHSPQGGPPAMTDITISVRAWFLWICVSLQIRKEKANRCQDATMDHNMCSD